MMMLQAGGLGRGKGRGTFTPAQLPTPPMFWVNDSSSVTDTGGGACSQWNDISGNAYHLVQPGGATARPLIVSGAQNGRRAIRFDTSTDNMYNQSAGLAAVYQNQPQGWMFLVAKKTALDGATTPGRSIITTLKDTASTRFGYAWNGNGVQDKGQIVARRLDADGLSFLNMATTLDTNYHIHVPLMDWSTGASTIRYDGSQDAHNATLTSAGNTSNTAAYTNIMYFGVTANINGEIAEAALLRTIPSTFRVLQTEGYLAWRWGLTANLPQGHPYKYFAP